MKFDVSASVARCARCDKRDDVVLIMSSDGLTLCLCEPCAQGFEARIRAIRCHIRAGRYFEEGQDDS